MDFKELFETQAALEAVINEKHPIADGEDRLSKKILALQVELGELAQEWRGFKFWSTNQQSRTVEKVECSLCNGTGDENYEWVQEAAEGSGGHEYIECSECKGTGYDGERNPLLEEYADCLHFILSIGNDLGGLSESFEKSITFYSWEHWSVEKNFFEATKLLVNVQMQIESRDKDKVMYALLLQQIIRLGHKLGFSWDEVEAAYFTKNNKNHVRQERGY